MIRDRLKHIKFRDLVTTGQEVSWVLAFVMSILLREPVTSTTSCWHAIVGN